MQKLALPALDFVSSSVLISPTPYPKYLHYLFQFRVILVNYYPWNMGNPHQGVHSPHTPSLLGKIRDELWYLPYQVRCGTQVIVLHSGKYMTIIIDMVGADAQVQYYAVNTNKVKVIIIVLVQILSTDPKLKRVINTRLMLRGCIYSNRTATRLNKLDWKEMKRDEWVVGAGGLKFPTTMYLHIWLEESKRAKG